jgi:hypothetical protein
VIFSRIYNCELTTKQLSPFTTPSAHKAVSSNLKWFFCSA